MPTHYNGSPQEVLALNAFIKLKRANDSITKRLSPHLAEKGLTESQLGVLEALLHLGPLCQKELGEKILKSTGNITLVIDNLEKNGWVLRHREATDRRFITIHLTDQGHQLISGMFPDHVKKITDIMSVLNEKELTELSRICEKVGKAQ